MVRVRARAKVGVGVRVGQVEGVAQRACGGALGHAVALDHVHTEGDAHEVLGRG